jgi:predicted dehydrogenase
MSKDNLLELNRRSFIGNFSAVMTMLGGVSLNRAEQAQEQPKAERYSGPPVNCAVIGCGVWGRELLSTLSRTPKANVVGVCDTYPAFLKRGHDAAPKAEKFDNYQKVLASKDVHAVFIATPTHLHKQLALDAMAAGKHVYIEVPIAHTVADAREIAAAAKKNVKVNVQSGLQKHSDPELINVLNFVRAGAAGTPVVARAQWHKKNSWRRSSPNPDREKELNWRLQRETSLGLVGELGIHQIDTASWFMKQRPVAVTGFGSTILWNDGREVPDTVQAVFDYPGGARLVYDASLATSFDAEYDVLHGTDATVMLRERRGWMFKEVDSPLLGWEVYARKETFFKEVGIVLAANATKLAAQGDNPVIDTQTNTQTSLFYAIENFLFNTDLVKTGVSDFTTNFGGDDLKALADYLADLAKSRVPAADIIAGYEATIAAIKAHEAVMKGGRVPLADELFAFA